MELSLYSIRLHIQSSDIEPPKPCHSLGREITGEWQARRHIDMILL